MYNQLSFLLLFCMVLLLNSCTKVDSNFISNVETYQTDGFITIPTDQGSYQIKVFSDHIIETSFIPKGESFTEASHAVIEQTKEPAVDLDITENGIITYGTKGVKVIVNPSPFDISYWYKDKQLISERKGYIQKDSTEILDFRLDSTEKIYGAGARVVGMNRRGHRLQLYNKAHYGYETDSKLMNFCMPLVFSSKQYAVHFDDPAIGYLDVDSQKDNSLKYETIGGRKTYQVIAADHWKDLIHQYTNLTGKQPLPPRWAFGNFASRFGYHSEAEVTDVVDRFEKDSIPLDALVLDIYWFGKNMKDEMGNLEFLKDSFPTPKKMIHDLKEKGIQTVLITEPFILSSSKKWKEAVKEDILAKDSLGNPYRFDFYFGNTGLIDIYNPKAKKWFWDIYKNYIQDYGVGGWWGDLGEPEVHPSDLRHAVGGADEVHNIYGHDWARMLQKGYQKDFPNQRPFILMRAGYSGSQRFGMLPWSGDVNRSWGGLQAQTEIALQMGIQGMGYMHSDLGGFAGGEKFDPELYIRWLQYGVFQPIYRPHAQEHIAPEPVFHDATTKALAKKAIELRYRLLPYNYTLAFENHRLGLPLMRPLFFEEPNNSSLLETSDAYLWGDAMLVKPIVKPSVKTTTVYFPKGSSWFDFYTGERYGGGQTTQVEVQSQYIPTFVRGGAFVPLSTRKGNTEDYKDNLFELHYYHDTTVAKSTGQLYCDNGKTPMAFEKGKYELLTFTSEQNEHKIAIHLDRELGKQYDTKDKEIILKVHNLQQAPKSIALDTKEIEFTWHPTTKIVEIPVLWAKGKKEITLQID